MKKVLLFIFAVLLVCVACTKEKPVVGTWELVNSDISGENVLELKADGSGSIRGGENKEEYTVKWTRDGDKIYLAAEGEREVGVYEVVSGDGKTLVLSIDGDLYYFKKKSSNIFIGGNDEDNKGKEKQESSTEPISIQETFNFGSLPQIYVAPEDSIYD